MKDKCFEAGNLYLATYLLSCGFAMKGIEGSGRLKRILFDDIPAVHKACEEFFADSEGRNLFMKGSMRWQKCSYRAMRRKRKDLTRRSDVHIL